jgi:hypothetical protein
MIGRGLSAAVAVLIDGSSAAAVRTAAITLMGAM